jgi:hypothetical protein
MKFNFYLDNAKEYVEADDFLVKGKYNFMAKNFVCVYIFNF